MNKKQKLRSCYEGFCGCQVTRTPYGGIAIERACKLALRWMNSKSHTHKNRLHIHCTDIVTQGEQDEWPTSTQD